MKEWKEILVELAKKLTAPFAFAVLIIIVVAVFGERIPPGFQALIYIVVIGVMGIYAWSIIVDAKRISNEQDEELVQKEQPSSEEVENETLKTPQDELEISGDNIDDHVFTDITSARENYLEALIRDCSPMRLVGLDPNAADPVRGGLSLENVYIALDTTTNIKADLDEENAQDEFQKIVSETDREKTRPLSALDALAQSKERKVVLLGLPGTGKSTFVRYLTLRMAQILYYENINCDEVLPGWERKPLLPLIIPLGRLAESLPRGSKKGHVSLSS